MMEYSKYGVSRRRAGSPFAQRALVERASSTGIALTPILIWGASSHSSQCTRRCFYEPPGKGCQSKPAVSPHNSLKTNERRIKQVAIFRGAPSPISKFLLDSARKVEIAVSHSKQSTGASATRHLIEGVSERHA